MPFLTKLTGLVIELANGNSEIGEMLKNIAEWKEYQAIDYKKTVDNENLELGAAFKFFDPENIKNALNAKGLRRMSVDITAKRTNGLSFQEYPQSSQ